MTWKLAKNELDQDQLLVNESLLALGNGYIGVRGNFEEGYGDDLKSIRGTYINAFHDETKIKYGEKLYAFPDQQQKLANVIDAQGIDIFLDDEHFNLFEGKVVNFNRTLHIDEGYTSREVHWVSPNGREVKVNFNRLVSFSRKELFAIQVTVEPIRNVQKVKIVSTVNGNVTNYVEKGDPRVNSEHTKLVALDDARVVGDYRIVQVSTMNTNLSAACVTSYTAKASESIVDSGVIRDTFQFEAGSGPIVLTKKNVYTDTLRHGDDVVSRGVELQRELASFDHLLVEQKYYLDEFWKIADIEVQGDQRLQQGIRFNLFHLLQSVGKDSVSNIAAKGLSGEGYEGHYFWDTEIYIFPFFLMTNPEMAKSLLMHRYSTLDHARNRAKQMGHEKGALFPWRTITGPESSAFFPAGTAQYHISADIAYSFIQYYLVTKDVSFMQDYLAEVLFETARLWVDTGHMRDGQFRIDNVTGPDEYTCIVNNNFYTNSMAKYNLDWAYKIYQELDDKAKTDIQDRIGLEVGEVLAWKEAADYMYLPYSEKLGINEQDDTFLSKKVWDFDNTSEEDYPLLLNYHPLTLYRHQVCKQADTVLAHFLVEDHQDEETIRRSYDYYEKVTTHDSSLSYCVFSIMAAKLGYKEKAYRYFNETARLDLDNLHKNTKDGLHMANMGGTWLALVYGFAGLRLKEDGLHFSPVVVEEFGQLSFHIKFQGRTLKVELSDKFVHYTVMEGESLNIHHIGKGVQLEPGQRKSFTY